MGDRWRPQPGTYITVSYKTTTFYIRTFTTKKTTYLFFFYLVLGSLQEKNSRLNMYYFYYGNTCDIWVAAIFDTVEDGFNKNSFPLEAEVYRVVVSSI